MLRWQASLALGPDSLPARSSLKSHKHRKPVGGITQKGQGLDVATEQGGVDMGYVKKEWRGERSLGMSSSHTSAQTTKQIDLKYQLDPPRRVESRARAAAWISDMRTWGYHYQRL